VRLLLLVPAGAAAIGARRAAAAATSVAEGMLRSLLAACVFAALVGVVVWASTITFATGPAGTGPTQELAIGARPLESAGYALAWGAIVGGISGAAASLRRGRDVQKRASRASPR
jgi:hypothetical protein